MINPQEEAEKLMVKNPRQFAGWVKPDQQINAELGAKMAKWAMGDAVSATPTAPPAVSAEAKKVLAKLDKLGVSEARALSLLGRTNASDMTEQDLDILNDRGLAIWEKRQTIDEAFPPTAG